MDSATDRLHALVTALDAAYCEIEVLFDGDRAVDYRFLETNASFPAQTGLAGVLGKRATELTPELESHWFELYGRVAATGEPARVVRMAAALERWFEVNAFRIGAPAERRVGVLFRDVTAREQDNLRARASEVRAALALSIARLGTFRYDIAQGSVALDARMRAQWGEAPDVAVLPVARVVERIHPEDRARVQAAVTAALDAAAPAQARGHYAIDYRIVWPDGSVRWIEVNGLVRFDGAGAEAHALELTGTVLDITERKRDEAALLATETRLRETDARKDEFLATLAHELRNPLATIRTAVGLLGMAPGQLETGHLQEMMERQLEQMVRLIDDLMEVSRISRGAIVLGEQDLDLCAVVREAVDASRPAMLLAHHALLLALPPVALPVRGDRVRLAQVLSNLLSNAIRYSDAGGRIEVRAREEDGQAIVEVVDSGIGIGASRLEEVFEMFVQIDKHDARSHGGLGIGLALARKLARMHGGDISAHSDGPGRGSRFMLRLPLSDVAPSAAASPSIAANTSRGTRVLVVDDNRDAADTTAMALRSFGAEARVAYGGAEALALLEAWLPDVMLLDLGMPGMNGFAVAARVRASRRYDGLRLVALTGWGQPEDLARTHAGGFDDHLVKPASAEALRTLLPK